MTTKRSKKTSIIIYMHSKKLRILLYCQMKRIKEVEKEIANDITNKK